MGLLVFLILTTQSASVRVDHEAVVARVLDVSAAISGAEMRVRAATRSVSAVDALLLPSVSVSASAFHRSSVPPFSVPLPGAPVELVSNIRDVYATGARLDYILFSGGGVTGARRAARQDLEAARQAGVQTRHDLKLLATSAYWNAVRAVSGVAAAEAGERRALRVKADVEALDGVGMATPADLAAARERVASATVQLIRARALSDTALLTLRSLMHLDSTTIELADSLGGALPPWPDSLSVLKQQAVAARPEIAAGVARREALRARGVVAGARSSPDIFAVAQWDYGRPNGRYFPAAEEWNDSWSVGLVGSWLVFDGGKARAEGRSLDAAATAAARDLAELERVVLLEVEAACTDLKSALSSVPAADAAREAAVERERQVHQRHQSGVATTAEVLDAEAQLSAAEGMVIETISGAWIAAARLERAVGR